jgi:hypothetical protein
LEPFTVNVALVEAIPKALKIKGDAELDKEIPDSEPE